MKWNIRIAETAEREITALSLPLQKLTFDRFDRLEIEPSKCSKRNPSIPGPPNCMLSELLTDIDGKRHLIRILFRFNVDEVHLDILAVGHVTYADDDYKAFE
jgi:hypothetical protein